MINEKQILPLKGMRALVTGGAGFIGSHIVDLLLSQGVEVRVLDNLTGGRLENLEHHKNNSALSFFNLDITTVAIDHSIFQDVSWIFHMAGIGDIVPSMEKPLDYFHTNTFGTARIAEAARKARVNKIVYAASSSCYGIAAVVLRRRVLASADQMLGRVRDGGSLIRDRGEGEPSVEIKPAVG